MKRIERVALDSSAVILYFRGQPAAVELFAGIRQMNLPLVARDEHFGFIEGLEIVPL